MIARARTMLGAALGTSLASRALASLATERSPDAAPSGELTSGMWHRASLAKSEWQARAAQCAHQVACLHSAA